MKIAIFCLALYAYVVSATKETSGRRPEARHTVQLNSGHYHQGHNLVHYRPPVQPHPQLQPWPQPWPVPQPRPWTQPVHQPRSWTQPHPPRKNSPNIDRFVFSYFLYRALRPSTTAPTTMTVATTTANLLADWTQLGDSNCYYILSASTATWYGADSACKGLVGGGRLAVVGFNAQEAERRALINALGGTDLTFWIGVDGAKMDALGTELGESFISPLDGVSATGTATGLTSTSIVDELDLGDPVCGRVDADIINLLRFEACGVAEYRYMCESCP